MDVGIALLGVELTGCLAPGLLEIGPCSVNPDLTTSLNPFSWSEYSNLLFLSQPVGVGFSYGTVAEGMQDGCKVCLCVSRLGEAWSIQHLD